MTEDFLFSRVAAQCYNIFVQERGRYTMKTEDMQLTCLETYKAEVLSDAEDFIDENIDEYDSFSDMYEMLEDDDSVTGNASGSYTFNRETARRSVISVIDSTEFIDMLHVFDIDITNFIKNSDWEGLDVLFRCYLLSNMEDELNDYWDAKKEEQSINE